MAINAGSNLNSVPSPGKQATAGNYLDFTDGTNDFAQQYLPDLMAQEAEVFGPRTISGFLAQVGAEEGMTADQVIWSEQSRLHLSYKGKMTDATSFLVQCDIDENNFHTDGIDTNGGRHGIRVNDTVIIAGANNAARKCIVTGVNADDITLAAYDNVALSASDSTDKSVTLLVYGSEFGKGASYRNATDATTGTADSRTANEPEFKTFSNKPIIMKDYYEVSGSDASRIGWVEVTSETGMAGYLWYLKAESDTRARFTDYVEMSMLESIKGDTAGAADAIISEGNAFGTQGLFDAITDRGNVTTGVTGVNAATDLAEFDAILAEFDKQGAIEEYMMFVNRATSLAMDDMLASMNSYGAGGTSYGVFENDADMALNLGFSGFRRGSYDFYKSDFRYLNDKATRGGINDALTSEAIRGVMIPAGVSTVYDQQVGMNMKRPFLHVRFRASQTDDRRMKSWVTGSVGAATSALDAMQLHFLTERCLVCQGANNFMLMK